MTTERDADAARVDAMWDAVWADLRAIEVEYAALRAQGDSARVPEYQSCEATHAKGTTHYHPLRRRFGDSATTEGAVRELLDDVMRNVVVGSWYDEPPQAGPAVARLHDAEAAMWRLYDFLGIDPGDAYQGRALLADVPDEGEGAGSCATHRGLMLSAANSAVQP